MKLAKLFLAGSLVLPQTGPAAPAPQAAERVLEEILVIAARDRRTFELAESMDIAPDVAELLRRAAGANVVRNGPLSSMAQYRGMTGPRVSTRVNGQHVAPGGPNWMDPPLSYAPAAQLESLTVHRGIASVSAGPETIGGAVEATTWQGGFSAAGPEVQGRIRTGAHSVDRATLLSAALVLAGETGRFKLAGLTEAASDARFPGGRILPTEYRRDRLDAGFALRRGSWEWQLQYGRQDTGNAGTPALPMDIDYIVSDLASLAWLREAAGVRVEGQVYYSGIDHGMTNYHLRPPPAASGRFRRNVTDAQTLGLTFSVAGEGWRLGVDGYQERHASFIDNPRDPSFFVSNFHDVERRLLGVYGETLFPLGATWSGELGLRYNRVASRAGRVDASPARSGMLPAIALRDRFNRGDRRATDNNVDLVARLRHAWSEALSLHLSVARKSRSPSYQERYLWMPLEATGGLADGRTYTGDPDLRSEVAGEVELGIDYRGRRFRVAPRVFYRDVQDYIQGGVSRNAAAVMLVRMMNLANGTELPDPLEFQNVNATFAGFDVDWEWDLGGNWSLAGTISHVRGRAGDDNVYRLPPLNGHVAITHERDRWGVQVEGFFAASQNRVARYNGEARTGGYGLLNLRGYRRFGRGVQLSAGVDNLADTYYTDHLGGTSRVRGNPDIAAGDRLPGYGRNVFARLDLAF